MIVTVGWNFDAQNLKICKIHRQLRIKQTSVLFCKYLLNESSNLYEIYFAYFQDLSIKVPTNYENYMKPVGACGNYISKCPDIRENMAPLLVHTVLFNKSF